MTGPTPEAFRAQLIIPDHRELFDYWRDKARTGKLPSRSDISPAHFPRLLPFISLIDYETATDRFRIRLAGTRLREVYECEITGHYIDELDLGTQKSYWMSVYQQIAATAQPAQGVVRGPRKSKEHLVQFWLRLPLASSNGRVGMVLSHDAIIPAVEMPDHQAALA